MWRAIRGAMPARHRGVTVAGLLVVGALALAAGLASIVVPGSPTEIARDLALRGPTWAQPFGMDDLGRSMLSRVVHAYRVSLGVALGSVGLALLAGVPLGLVAGYAEGALDQLIMRPLDVLMSFPAILLAIALMSVFGTGVVLVAVVARGGLHADRGAGGAGRGARGQGGGVRRRRPRAGGAGPRLVLRHILPNAATPILVQASVLMAIAILVEASLSFLGVGVRPPTPSLGLMLADGRGFMLQAPWMVDLPRPRDHARGPRLQHDRRRPPRLARPASSRGPLKAAGR